MPIVVKSTEELPESKSFNKTPKVHELGKGDYICKVMDTRFNPSNERFNESYYIDLKVVEGPKGVGSECHWCKYPQDAKGGKNKKTGKLFTAKQAQAADEVAVQKATAAIYGLAANEAGELTQEQMDAAFPPDSDPETREPFTSPVNGRFVRVRVKTYTKDDGTEGGFGEIFPCDRAPEPEKGKAAPAAAKTEDKPEAKKPALPGKPAAKKPFIEAAELAGFIPYDGNPGFFLRLEGGEPVEVVGESDVKSKLGY
ncbi:MAG: hypothetical protein RLZZ450_112 [Pseudomonadota bacterium]|jgi:hypothetical protein